MIVLDANVLIAYLDQRDDSHRSALDLLESQVAEELRASVLTVAEALVHPTRHGRDGASLDSLSAIGVEVVGVSADEARDIARLRAESRLRMPDAVVLHLAVKTSGAVATFDTTLARVARDAGVEVVGA
ncbi:hypothetical protein GCM10025867_44230 [Frondihabitans sucicola]|uniref:Ribonuclease VapC n=1 Tax=Frondihabitans sucicola TaxID=1268041 RepID=A0ABN6Y4A6_9MICO|nr:type II toxin-antitoxin system VapC family toxin [Frondihabitans sucicola]BDZ52182.1 hypothetical protein GCM10025867_44230 [Frondihabitans sucicola]